MRSTYKIDISNTNYINAIKQYNCYVHMDRINSLKADAGLTCNDLPKLFNRAINGKLTIDVSSEGSDSSINIFPPVRVLEEELEKKQASIQDPIVVPEINEVRDYVNHVSGNNVIESDDEEEEKNPPVLPPFSERQALSLLCQLRAEDAGISCALHLPQQKAILFQKEGINFVLHYGDQTQLETRCITFDIDDGFGNGKGKSVSDSDSDDENTYLDNDPILQELQQTYFEPWKANHYQGMLIPYKMLVFQSSKKSNITWNSFAHLRETQHYPLTRFIRSSFVERMADAFRVFYGDIGESNAIQLGLLDYIFPLGLLADIAYDAASESSPIVHATTFLLASPFIVIKLTAAALLAGVSVFFAGVAHRIAQPFINDYKKQIDDLEVTIFEEESGKTDSDSDTEENTYVPTYKLFKDAFDTSQRNHVIVIKPREQLIQEPESDQVSRQLFLDIYQASNNVAPTLKYRAEPDGFIEITDKNKKGIQALLKTNLFQATQNIEASSEKRFQRLEAAIKL